jgi:lipid-binding SYLF domain-containing protein
MKERMKRNSGLAVLSILLVLLCGMPLFADDEDQILQERYKVREMSMEGLAGLYEIQPSARFAVEHAAGYGVFSTFGVKIFFAGGTTGKGLVHNNRTGRNTYMRMVQAQAGLGFGAKKDRVIFVFETNQALSDFVNAGWDFGGKMQVVAMLDKQGGMFTGAVSVAPGVWLYQLTDTGLAAELTVTGSKYYKDSNLN